ncbi:MAG: hypothetical protein ACNA7L_05110, partial [Roseinatronobacter sp.]
PAGVPEEWLQEASFNEGSWWPHWEAWLSKRAGAQVPARIPGDSEYKALCDAPGTYVTSSKNNAMS